MEKIIQGFTNLKSLNLSAQFLEYLYEVYFTKIYLTYEKKLHY